MLSSRDVCDILSSCAENKVSVLKFGDLYVRFGPTAEDLATNTIVEGQEQETRPKPNSDNAISEPPDHVRINREGIEDEEIKTRAEQFAELIITNPLAAEELLLNEELEDDDDNDFADE